MVKKFISKQFIIYFLFATLMLSNTVVAFANDTSEENFTPTEGEISELVTIDDLTENSQSESNCSDQHDIMFSNNMLTNTDTSNDIFVDLYDFSDETNEVSFNSELHIFENATQIGNATFGPGENRYNKVTNINTNSITSVVPENTSADPDRPALGPEKLEIGQPYFQYNYYPIERYGDPLESNTSDTLFYYFEATEDGKYTVTLNAKSSYSLLFDRINAVGDSERTNPMAKLNNEYEIKQLSAGLKKGVYLIYVYSNNAAAYDDKIFIRVDYENINSETDNEWIKLEPNNGFNEAMSIPLGKTITGSKCIGQSKESGENDYFQFDIPQNGIINLTNVTNILNATIYTSDKTNITSYYYNREADKKYSRSIGLAPGTYYIKVSSVYDEINFDATKYTFKIDFTPDQNIEIEPNSLINNATAIEINKTYWASCIDNADTDIFKITLPSATKNLKINFSKDMTGASIDIGKYSSSPNPYTIQNNCFILDKELDAGEYYISLHLFKDATITENNNTFRFNVGGKVSNDDPQADDTDDVVDDDIEYFLPDETISNTTITVTGVKDVTYTGSAITFDLRVYAGKTLLKEGTDYSVRYLNNKNVPALDATDLKKPQVVVTGKGVYRDKEIYKFSPIYFKINPIDVAELKSFGKVTVSNETVLSSPNKKLVKPVPTITLNGKKLSKKDYTIDYGTEKISGIDTSIIAQNTITLTGIGNYTGSITSIYDVVDKNSSLISKSTVTGIVKNIAYNNGNEIQQKNYIVKCKVGKTNTTLTEGADFTVTYVNNKEVGSASMIISAVPGNDKNLTGEKVITFQIVGIASSRLIYDYPKNIEYTGNTIKPGVDGQPTLTITDKTDKSSPKVLKYGIDYEVDYIKNIQVGTATMIITGKGIYTGTVKKTFRIVPVDLGKNTNVKASVVDGSVKKETTGKFKNKYTAKVIVTFNGRTLKEERDYVLSYKFNTENDLAKNNKTQVIITGKGNYAKAINLNFDNMIK